MIANIDPTAGKPAKPDSDFKNLVDLLAVYSEIDNRLEELQAETNQEYLQVIDDKKSDYAQLQEKMLATEKALEILVRRHPEWLTEKKTIKTPYGQTSLKDNPPKIVADNEEVSLALLEAEGHRVESLKAAGQAIEDFNPKLYIRETKSLNLEALGGMTDEQLRKFRLRREQSDTFSVKSAKLDLGKAVKEAAAKEGK